MPEWRVQSLRAMKKSCEATPKAKSRREFLRTAVSGAATAALPPISAGLQTAAPTKPDAFSFLQPLGSRIKPISNDEFRARLSHAQQLMSNLSPKFDALFVAPGT